MRVALNRFVVPADPDVDVRRHMDEMTRAGRETGEPLRARQGPCRLPRLNRMNVVMAGTNMVGTSLQGLFEDTADFRRARLRLPIGGPISPWPHVHQCLGI